MIDLSKYELSDEVKASIMKDVEADTAGLKNKNNELLSESKELKEKLVASKQAEGAKLSESEKLIKRVEELEKRNADSEAELQKTKQENNDKTINEVLSQSLSELNVSSPHIKAVKALIRSENQIEINDSGMAVVGDKPLGDFVKDWGNGDGKHFISAPNNTGGSAKGGSASGASTKKASEMSDSEKVAYISENGQEAYESLVDKG